jgi:hypothetical protein
MIPKASARHRIPLQINPLASLISELSVWRLAVRMYTRLDTSMFELHADSASLVNPCLRARFTCPYTGLTRPSLTASPLPQL